MEIFHRPRTRIRAPLLSCRKMRLIKVWIVNSTRVHAESLHAALICTSSLSLQPAIVHSSFRASSMVTLKAITATFTLEAKAHKHGFRAKGNEQHTRARKHLNGSISNILPICAAYGTQTNIPMKLAANKLCLPAAKRRGCS